MARKLSRRARRKVRVVELLRLHDLDALERWFADEATVISSLVGLLSEQDELLRWRAIEAIGQLGAALESQGRRQVVLDQVRRQFWSMNDESGGVAWHAPEAIGELLFRVPGLAQEFATVLSSRGEEEPFERGVHWAVARLAAGPARDNLRQDAPMLQRSLTSEDPARRAWAAVALARLGLEADAGQLQRLSQDDAVFNSYDFDRGQLVQLSVAAALASH